MSGGLPQASTVIWLLCHYPDTPEADERIERAVAEHRRAGHPIWLFGTAQAGYPEPVDRLIKRKLIARGVAAEAVRCASDDPAASPSLDTVQEADNVVAAAKREGVQRLICVSNRLQLFQVRAMFRREALTFLWAPTKLRDRRWWYVLGRVALIPLAQLGVGRGFLPLIVLREARARIRAWPF
jgi:uncharacterized SAM-binding protein YcdF (DUF218 family)